MIVGFPFPIQSSFIVNYKGKKSGNQKSFQIKQHSISEAINFIKKFSLIALGWIETFPSLNKQAENVWKYRKWNEGKADTGRQNDNAFNIERSDDSCVGVLVYERAWWPQNRFLKHIQFIWKKSRFFSIPIQFCSSIIFHFFPFLFPFYSVLSRNM